jgi:hypothetical protein
MPLVSPAQGKLGKRLSLSFSSTIASLRERFRKIAGPGHPTVSISSWPHVLISSSMPPLQGSNIPLCHGRRSMAIEHPVLFITSRVHDISSARKPPRGSRTISSTASGQACQTSSDLLQRSDFHALPVTLLLISQHVGLRQTSQRVGPALGTTASGRSQREPGGSLALLDVPQTRS